jgi:hypothetical protein
MSIRFYANPFPQGVVTGDALAERNRCALILEGLPLGYRNDGEHEVLEDFVRRAVILIRLGVTVEESID